MSTFNWDFPSQNKVTEIRQEAKRLNVPISAGMKKNEMLELLMAARERVSNPQTTVNLKRSPGSYSSPNHTAVNQRSPTLSETQNQTASTFISPSLLNDDSPQNQSPRPLVSPKQTSSLPQVNSKSESYSYSSRSPTPIRYCGHCCPLRGFMPFLPYLVIIFLILALCREEFAPIAVILLIFYLVTLIYKKNPRNN